MEVGKGSHDLAPAETQFEPTGGLEVARAPGAVLTFGALLQGTTPGVRMGRPSLQDTRIATAMYLSGSLGL